MPLLIATYFAALTPIDILRIAGNGKPCFCDMEPIILEKIMTKKPELNKEAKTNTKLRLYKLGYTGTDTQDGIFTDFDNPPFYDTTTKKIKKKSSYYSWNTRKN